MADNPDRQQVILQKIQDMQAELMAEAIMDPARWRQVLITIIIVRGWTVNNNNQRAGGQRPAAGTRHVVGFDGTGGVGTRYEEIIIPEIN